MHRLKERLDQLREVTGASRNCGWMIDEVAFLLYAMVKFQRPDLTIQTGHLWGKSALFVLEALTDGAELIEDPRENVDRGFMSFVNAHRPPASSPLFYSIDPCLTAMDRPAGGPAGIGLLEQWYPATFKFFHMKSSEFFLGEGPSLASQFAGKCIMTIIDGDHTEAGCLADLEASAAIGASVIFVDDTEFSGDVHRAVRNFLASFLYTSISLHLYNGITILVRKDDNAN